MSPGRKHGEDHLSRAGRALLVALAFILPFEAPLFQVGPLVVTSAELLLYLVLAVWGLGVARGLAQGVTRVGDAVAAVGRDRVARAVVLWLAVVAVAALAAPAHRGAALKFALRTTSGVLLYFAARDLIRSGEDASLVVVGVLGGAALSAGSALLETALPDAGMWHLFRPSAFTALGLRRNSGAFAYPTIAAMYWEAALPLAVAIPALTLAGWSHRARANGLDRHAIIRGATAVALSGLLVIALVLSVTRSALVGAAMACVATLALGWRSGRSVRLAAGGSLALLAVLVASPLFGHQGDARLGERLRFWRDGEWFRVRYTVPKEPLQLATGGRAEVPLSVQNTGTLSWPHGGANPVLLSYHWERRGPEGARLLFEGERTPLPLDVAPGGSVSVAGKVQAPDEPGRYTLRWDLVWQDVTWFSVAGNPTGDEAVDVAGAPLPPAPDSEVVAASLEGWITPVTPPRSELWRAAVRLWRQHPLLGVGPDNFRRRYPEVIKPAHADQRFSDDRLHANNLYLETLADMGLCGLAALLLLMVTLVRVARDRLVAGAGVLAISSAVALGTFFVHGLLDYFLEFTPTYGLYWLLMALASGGWRTTAANPAPPGNTP